MTQQQYIINRKLSIIDLGKTLGNISDACRKLGVSRQHYYDIKKAIDEEGLEGLLEKSRAVPRIGNRVPPEIEQKVLDYALQFPVHGQVRVSNELKKHGIMVSAEAWAAENTNVLTESQVKALEEAKEEKEAYGEVESPHPAFLLAQDTCYIGTIKGVGRIYQQTAIDTHSNLGFAKLYIERTALTAADFLNDRVLPFFDEHSMRVLRVLTDNGMEYCGRPESHPYELYLKLNEIEHTRIRVRRPQTNGSVERLNQTIKDEFYAVAFRKKLYRTIEEIQPDLDEFMEYYNNERTNQGRYCQGRTPMQTFEDGKELYCHYVYDAVDEIDISV